MGTLWKKKKEICFFISMLSGYFWGAPGTGDFCFIPCFTRWQKKGQEWTAPLQARWRCLVPGQPQRSSTQPHYPEQGWECSVTSLLASLLVLTVGLWPSLEGKCGNVDPRWMWPACLSAHVTLSLRLCNLPMLMSTGSEAISSCWRTEVLSTHSAPGTV